MTAGEERLVGIGSWYKSQSGPTQAVIIAALITGACGLVGGIIVAVITGVFGLLSKAAPPGPGPIPPTSSPPASSALQSTLTQPPTPTPVACDQQFRITAPEDGTRISASEGVTMEGAACESDLLWVLDYDPTDGSYFQVNSEPLHIVGGQWTQVNEPIGDKNDEVGTVYTIVVMRVSQACSDHLRNAKGDADGTVWFNPLPPGCPNLEDKTNVRLVRVVNARP